MIQSGVCDTCVGVGGRGRSERFTEKIRPTKPIC